MDRAQRACMKAIYGVKGPGPAAPKQNGASCRFVVRPAAYANRFDAGLGGAGLEAAPPGLRDEGDRAPHRIIVAEGEGCHVMGGPGFVRRCLIHWRGFVHGSDVGTDACFLVRTKKIPGLAVKK